MAVSTLWASITFIALGAPRNHYRKVTKKMTHDYTTLMNPYGIVNVHICRWDYGMMEWSYGYVLHRCVDDGTWIPW